MILAGDIGGTKSLLGFYEPGGDARLPTEERNLPSRNYAGLADLLRIS
jgi:hypothetical protein